MMPQTNATLLAVARGGESSDYEKDATEGPNVLDKPHRCYASERRATLSEANALNQATISYAIIPGSIAVESGDVLTIEQRGSTFKRTVREIRVRGMDGLPSMPTRLDFEEA